MRKETLLTRTEMKKVFGGTEAPADCRAECTCKSGRITSNGTNKFTVTASCSSGVACSATDGTGASCAGGGASALCADFEDTQCYNA